MDTHKIKFKDGKIEYITEDLYNNIWRDSTTGTQNNFKANGKVYLFEDIRRMEPVEKRQMFDVDQYIKNKTPANRLRALKNIGIGLKRYINSSRYKGTQNPIKLLENIREVYKEVII